MSKTNRCLVQSEINRANAKVYSDQFVDVYLLYSIHMKQNGGEKKKKK